MQAGDNDGSVFLRPMTPAEVNEHDEKVAEMAKRAASEAAEVAAREAEQKEQWGNKPWFGN